ncbi:hypothetical protein BELL_0209g00080 [Botrytis elliptica]|uniref:Secreted protein n=1 Tax=Botrytis elliptica TaxID=278938 RepID=A0A4Z1JW85_9HELO|nr:hypothetical protein BELL_0209g00080 [Botrytis elliptica]
MGLCFSSRWMNLGLSALLSALVYSAYPGKFNNVTLTRNLSALKPNSGEFLGSLSQEHTILHEIETKPCVVSYGTVPFMLVTGA